MHAVARSSLILHAVWMHAVFKKQPDPGNEGALVLQPVSCFLWLRLVESGGLKLVSVLAGLWTSLQQCRPAAANLPEACGGPGCAAR